jgi:hypothetical protein
MAGGQLPLQGRNPTQLAAHLSQRVLQYFSLDPDKVGYPLV